MDDIERLLLEAVKTSLAALSKKKIGLYDMMDHEGIHYIFNGKSYLITAKEEDDTTEKVERCVICGAIIPEGRQVCNECEENGS